MPRNPWLIDLPNVVQLRPAEWDIARIAFRTQLSVDRAVKRHSLPDVTSATVIDALLTGYRSAATGFLSPDHRLLIDSYYASEVAMHLVGTLKRRKRREISLLGREVAHGSAALARALRRRFRS